MKIAEIQKKARSMGVDLSGTMQAVIRRIQSAEGNQPCFGARPECDQDRCCWREYCLSGKDAHILLSELRRSFVRKTVH